MKNYGGPANNARRAMAMIRLSLLSMFGVVLSCAAFGQQATGDDPRVEQRRLLREHPAMVRYGPNYERVVPSKVLGTDWQQYFNRDDAENRRLRKLREKIEREQLDVAGLSKRVVESRRMAYLEPSSAMAQFKWTCYEIELRWARLRNG